MGDKTLAFGAVALFVIPEAGDIAEQQGDVVLYVPKSPILVQEGKTAIRCCKVGQVGGIIYDEGA